MRVGARERLGDRNKGVGISGGFWWWWSNAGRRRLYSNVVWSSGMGVVVVACLLWQWFGIVRGTVLAVVCPGWVVSV